MEWEAKLYKDNKGKVPVRAFIHKQEPSAQASMLHVIELLQQFGLGLGAPFVKHKAGNFRILYFAFTNKRFILLHAIKKK